MPRGYPCGCNSGDLCPFPARYAKRGKPFLDWAIPLDVSVPIQTVSPFDTADGMSGCHIGVDSSTSQAGRYAEDENLVDNDAVSLFCLGLVPRLQTAEHHKACGFDRRGNCRAAKYWRKKEVLKGF